MIDLIFSLDYEVYGTGKGDFEKLVLEPTDRLLSLFDEFGARLTIMAEVAEILALGQRDEFLPIAGKIESQLKRAIKSGHDVQLHLHPAWFNAKFEAGRWMLDLKEYSLTGLSRPIIHNYIRTGKNYLEELGRSVDSDYRCLAYRAGNWLMQPSADVVDVLESEGFLFDTSVFKYGYGKIGRYTLDYRDAYSSIFPWTVDPANINRRSNREGLKEVPIFSKRVFFTSMLTFKRVWSQIRLRLAARDSDTESLTLGSGSQGGGPRLFYPKKFDFCRLTFSELKRFLASAERFAGEGERLPVVAIGHSTEFRGDETLRKFFRYLKDREPVVGWTTFQGMAGEKAGVEFADV